MSLEVDGRVNAILEQLMQLALGNLYVYLEHSGQGDALDAIIESINMLTEELRNSRASLRSANEKLRRNEKLSTMGQLCGSVAHELRNPLGAIKNAAFFLRMAIDVKDPEVKETLDIIEREVQSSEAIISNLLDFSRPKLGSRMKVDINALLNECLTKLTVARNIEIVRQYDNSLNMILADPDQLKQAFTNIIQNALQAMVEKNHGSLMLSTERSGPDGIAISISDNGPGIPPDIQAKIFEPLFTTKSKGIGHRKYN